MLTHKYYLQGRQLLTHQAMEILGAGTFVTILSTLDLAIMILKYFSTLAIGVAAACYATRARKGIWYSASESMDWTPEISLSS